LRAEAEPQANADRRSRAGLALLIVLVDRLHPLGKQVAELREVVRLGRARLSRLPAQGICCITTICADKLAPLLLRGNLGRCGTRCTDVLLFKGVQSRGGALGVVIVIARVRAARAGRGRGKVAAGADRVLAKQALRR
jgi:hypothetical protein